jgi:heme/copper-type cytochrome/quinol oxidase subunit 1
MNIKERPHLLLLFAGLVLLIISIFSSSSIDIQVHDTYYVIWKRHLFIVFGIFVIFLWILYLFMVRLLYSRALSWIHILITIIPALFFISMPVWYHISLYDFRGYRRWNGILVIVIVALVIGQLILIVNLVIGLMKRIIKYK